jgi:hypothetical protein
MFVKIGAYIDYFGPYQLAELILFWKDPYNDSVMNLGERLEFTQPFFLWIHNKRKRKVQIRIDSYDSWNAAETIGLITLPILKQLKEEKHGSPFVDMEDVPENLRSNKPHQEDPLFHKRWDYVMNEIIYAFESINTEWQYELDHTSDEYIQKQNRIANGFVLFGKYYQALWD